MKGKLLAVWPLAGHPADYRSLLAKELGNRDRRVLSIGIGGWEQSSTLCAPPRALCGDRRGAPDLLHHPPIPIGEYSASRFPPGSLREQRRGSRPDRPASARREELPLHRPRAELSQRAEKPILGAHQDDQRRACALGERGPRARPSSANLRAQIGHPGKPSGEPEERLRADPRAACQRSERRASSRRRWTRAAPPGRPPPSPQPPRGARRPLRPRACSPARPWRSVCACPSTPSPAGRSEDPDAETAGSGLSASVRVRAERRAEDRRGTRRASFPSMPCSEGGRSDRPRRARAPRRLRDRRPRHHLADPAGPGGDSIVPSPEAAGDPSPPFSVPEQALRVAGAPRLGESLVGETRAASAPCISMRLAHERPSSSRSKTAARPADRGSRARRVKVRRRPRPSDHAGTSRGRRLHEQACGRGAAAARRSTLRDAASEAPRSRQRRSARGPRDRGTPPRRRLPPAARAREPSVATRGARRAAHARSSRRCRLSAQPLTSFLRRSTSSVAAGTASTLSGAALGAIGPCRGDVVDDFACTDRARRRDAAWSLR